MRSAGSWETNSTRTLRMPITGSVGRFSWRKVALVVKRVRTQFRCFAGFIYSSWALARTKSCRRTFVRESVTVLIVPYSAARAAFGRRQRTGHARSHGTRVRGTSVVVPVTRGPTRAISKAATRRETGVDCALLVVVAGRGIATLPTHTLVSCARLEIIALSYCSAWNRHRDRSAEDEGCEKADEERIAYANSEHVPLCLASKVCQSWLRINSELR